MPGPMVSAWDTVIPIILRPETLALLRIRTYYIRNTMGSLSCELLHESHCIDKNVDHLLGRHTRANV
jgi:hypothetical protein